MPIRQPTKISGSKTGSALSHARRLIQRSYNFANGCELAFGRAYHDFDAAIGTLFFD